MQHKIWFQNQKKNKQSTAPQLTADFISVKRDNEFLLALLEFTSSLIELDTVEQVLWRLAQYTIKSLDFEDCVIYMLQEDGKTLLQKAAYGPEKPRNFDIKTPFTLKLGEGIVGESARTKQCIVVDDTRQDSRYKVDDKHRASELAMPIIYNNKLLGVIDSEHSEKGFFKRRHIEMMQAVVSVLATKIVNSATIERLEHTIEELEYSR